MSNKSSCVLVLLALGVFLGASPAYAQNAAAPKSEQPRAMNKVAKTQATEDPIEELKKNREPYYVLRLIVLKIYDNAENRPRLIELLKDDNLPANVLTAVSLVMGEKNERATIPFILRALVSGRFLDSSENIRRFTLSNFHRKNSIFSDIAVLIEGELRSDSEESRLKFANAVALLPRLVVSQRNEKDRSEDSERLVVIRRLFGIWKKIPTGDSNRARVIANNLKILVGGFHDFPDLASWEAWLNACKDDWSPENRLSLAQIYRRQLIYYKEENSKLKEARRNEVADLIKRMRSDNVPPTRFILETDRTLRQMALLTLKGMAAAMTPERRSLAIKDLVTGLSQPQARGPGSEALYRDILQAAGYLGRKATPDEKDQLVTAIFEPRKGDVAETWSARLQAAGDIGFVGQESRLRKIYQLSRSADRLASPEWRQVRIAVIKLAQKVGVGIDLVGEALADEDGEVRGIAAVVLSVDKSAVDEKIVTQLATAASTEKDQGALIRMLEAMEVIVGKNKETLSPESLGKILSLDFATVEVKTSARLAIVLLSLTVAGDDYALQRPLALDLVRKVLSSKILADSDGLLTPLIKIPCEAVVPDLIDWLGKNENAEGQPQWGQLRDMVVNLVEAKGTWDRDLSNIWRACRSLAAKHPEKAASTGRFALDAAEKMPSLPKPLAIEEMRLEHENWCLTGKNEVLWQNTLDRRNLLVENAEADIRLRLGRAALAERLALVWASRRHEFNQIAITDLEACLKDKEALKAEARMASLIRLSRIQLLDGNVTKARQALDQVDKERRLQADGVFLDLAISCFSTPGDPALMRLRGLSEQWKRQAPVTLVWLRVVASALSSNVADWPKSLDVMPKDTPQELKVEITRKIKLRDALESVLRARLEGSISENEESVAKTNKEELVCLAATRSLGVLKTNPAAAEKIAGLLFALTKNKKVAWPKEANPTNLALLAKELETVRNKPTFDKKLMDVFLKTVGTHLYSLD